MTDPDRDRSRRTLALWLLGALGVGLLGFVLLDRNSGSSSGDGTPATTTTLPAGVAAAGPTSSDVESAPETAPEGDAGSSTTARPGSAEEGYGGVPQETGRPIGVDENGCSEHYSGACLPPPPADITCADIPDRNFAIEYGDPYGLDGPNLDGIACDTDEIIRGPEILDLDTMD